MAKSNGLGWTTLSVGDASNTATDIRNDLTNFSFTTPRAVQDVTGIDKSANERLLLLGDFTCTLNGVFNPSVSHPVLSTIPSTSVNRAVLITGNGKNLNMGATGAGNGAVILTDYPITRAATGELTFAVPGSGSTGTVPTWS